MKQSLWTRFVNLPANSLIKQAECDYVAVVLSQILLMPKAQDLPEYQALDAHNQSVFLDTCYDVRRSVSTVFSYAIDEQCRKQTILINAALFNGTLGKRVSLRRTTLNCIKL